MIAKKVVVSFGTLILITLGLTQVAWAKKLKVVVTSSSYAPIAKYVGGNKVIFY